jgi:tRNA isopentenyl-2-thiomethyl-A-37 hydroxylase MiaE
MAFVDPHGKTADLLLEYVPKERIRDVIHIAPFDVDFPISFNVLESVDPTKRHLVVSGLMSTFKKIWVDAWSARMEYILTNTLLALLEAPGTTLLGVNRMLSDKEYRKEIVSHVTDPSVKSFWVKEFANYTERMAAEAVPAIQNKVGQFTANPLIRNMIGQPVSTFDFRQAMDSRKIIIVNLSKGRIGDENMKLLGGLLVTKLYLAAMSRADVPDRVMKMLPNFYLFVDEFQNFANASFADILSEARKYKLNLTIAHQYIEQMDEIVRPAVFGNVGTMITFRVGATDAEALEQEFAPVFTVEDLVNMGAYQIYLKLMIDGLSSAPFSARTLNAIPHPDTSYVQEIIAASREQFARPRAEVEAIIVKFHEVAPPPKKQAVSAAPVSAPPVPVAPKVNPAPVVPVPTAAVAKPITPAPMAPVVQKKPAVVIPPPAVVKPVSLATLAPKPAAPKQDPKVPSAQNVNDLKSALAAAMNKAKIETKPQPAPISKPDDGFKSLASLKDLKSVQKTVEKQPAPQPVTATSAPVATPAPAVAPQPPQNPPTKPSEVPEEVLKQVLKVD